MVAEALNRGNSNFTPWNWRLALVIRGPQGRIVPWGPILLHRFLPKSNCKHGCPIRERSVPSIGCRIAWI